MSPVHGLCPFLRTQVLLEGTKDSGWETSLERRPDFGWAREKTSACKARPSSGTCRSLGSSWDMLSRFGPLSCFCQSAETVRVKGCESRGTLHCLQSSLLPNGFGFFPVIFLPPPNPYLLSSQLLVEGCLE